MSGLPKKYAKMGFKKGWKAFKSSKNKSITVRSTKVARKKSRRTSVRRKAKGFARKISKGARKNPMMTSALTAGIYGGLRGRTSNVLVPLVSQVPVLNKAGAWLDNITMIALTGALAKGKIPMVNKLPYARDIGKNGWVVEWAMLGSDIANSFGGATTTAVTGSNIIG